MAVWQSGLQGQSPDRVLAPATDGGIAAGMPLCTTAQRKERSSPPAVLLGASLA
jgi:hypothetical protein